MTQKQRSRRAPIYRVPPPRPEVLVVHGEPLAALLVYQHFCLLQRRHNTGSWCAYPVRPDAVAQVLGRVPVSSGILPEHCLAYGLHNGAPFYVIWVPPHTATLSTAARSYTIPLPPLIWAGHGQDYRIWALSTSARPAGREPLMRAPFPNCYDNGSVCWGSVEARPNADPGTLTQVLQLFLEESLFNAHVASMRSWRFEASILALWAALVEEGAESYPLDDLRPAGQTVADVCSGAVWGGR